MCAQWRIPDLIKLGTRLDQYGRDADEVVQYSNFERRYAVLHHEWTSWAKAVRSEGGLELNGESVRSETMTTYLVLSV